MPRAGRGTYGRGPGPNDRGGGARGGYRAQIDACALAEPLLLASDARAR